MEILGIHEEGILILPVARLILTNTADHFRFGAGAIPDEDVAALMDNPTSTFYGILIHNSSVRSKIKDIGIACEFKFIRLDNDCVELYVSGLKRIRIKEHKEVNGQLIGITIDEVKCPNNKPEEVSTLQKEILEFVMRKNEEIGLKLSGVEDPSHFADTVLDGVLADEDTRKDALNITSVLTRMREAHRAMIGNKEDSDTLGKAKTPEVQELIEKFNKLTLPKKAHAEIFAVLRTLTKMDSAANEFPSNLRYAEFAISLPWGIETTDNSIEHVEKELEVSHFGMEKPKERLLEYLAIKKLNPEAKGLTVLLDGSPGTGKTTLAVALGKAMGRAVERLSLGGCSDPSFFKGHGRTYSGSRYGRIMQAIQSSGSSNPIIVLDEVEKVGVGSQGDATASLLEILDPKTNHEFTDNYLGFSFDLSKVIFVATSNDRFAISPPVMDRCEYIACDGYTLTEKLKIATGYTIPEKAKDMGIPGTTITKPVLKYIIEGWTREAGVRGLEKAISSCLRKVAVEKSKGKDIKVTKKLVDKRLGRRYEEEATMAHTAPGIVTGMYFSNNGGGLLNIEAIITKEDGTGSLAVTGQCGDVMIESIALVKAHMIATDYGMDGENLDRFDIHLHMPEGATPKDGPSAGGAYALLFASLLMDRPVRPKLCLTGEANLHGHITAIGGLDQKCAGAVRNGMEIICLPKQNKRDWDLLPKHVKEGATYHFVETVEELLDIAFDYSDVEEVSTGMEKLSFM